MLRGQLVTVLVITMILTSSCQRHPKRPPESQKPQDTADAVEEDFGPSLNEQELKFGRPIFIRIFKEEQTLELWMREQGESFELVRIYPICRFSGNLGPKLREGDLQSPEGFYFVSASRLKPNSRFHLAFNLGYPNRYDRSRGRTGSALMIHGDCKSIGCYAMTDEIIEEIYKSADTALGNGQLFFRVHIFPFRMTEANMQRYKRSKWFNFWLNLKEGYDFFEREGFPPNVEVRNRRYVFEQPSSDAA